MSCADVFRCTTETHKTHKTDSARVVYPWHPFYGLEVTINGQRNRRGAIVFICSIVGGPNTSPLEVPAWMFDTAVCCLCRPAPVGAVTAEALWSLRRTLSASSNVIDEEHPSIVCGGFDEQDQQVSHGTARAVSDESPDSAVTSGDRPENRSSPGPTASSTCRSKDGRSQPFGGRS